MRIIAKLTLVAWTAAGALSAATTTTGVAATPSTLTYSYQVNNATMPAAQSVNVTATGSVATLPLSVQVASIPAGWVAVVPDTGRAPLSLSVDVNPTGLSPGSYSAIITIDTVPTSNNPATVTVTLAVKNPPSTLMVTSAAPNYTTGPATLSFSFTTGGANTNPASSIINVASTGDTIPFSVTAAAAGSGSGGSVWARVNPANQTPSLKTSGVALAGSSVPISVTIDPVTLATLIPGSYTNVVTVAANSAVNGSATITVTLVVAAGAPTVNSIFPVSVVAAPAVNPIITIYGDNFFSTSVVTLQQAGQGAPPAVTLAASLLSRKVLVATIPIALVQNPGNFNVIVTNPPPPSNPGQRPATIAFTVISATQPGISGIVNAASYLATATQTGTNPDPVAGGATSVSPRELITIFGQNLGPASPVAAAASVAVPNGPLTFPTALSGVSVHFQIPGTGSVAAPLIMVSGDQINALVPVEVGTVTGNAAPNNVVTVTVTNNGLTTAPFSATAVAFDPGVFSFDGLGKGQAAVLDYDTTSSSYLVNSTSAPATKSSTIIIYATGLGDLSDPTIVNGQVAGAATTLVNGTTRVDIDGQPSVVSYAGTTAGAVAGLVQINAIVPPTVHCTGCAVTLTVSVGDANTSRRSQQLVTIAVK